MSTSNLPLLQVYEGWDGYQVALVRAMSGLTSEQVTFRPAPHLRSAGEIISHIALGRLDWFHRMGAPGSGQLARRIAPWEGEKADTEDPPALQRWMAATDQHQQVISGSAADLLSWLEATWALVERTLRTWTVADLAQAFRHVYQGKTYVVTRQWVLWRMLAHDLHHGGELSLLLGLQGIAIADLGDQGGHLTELRVAEPNGSA